MNTLTNKETPVFEQIKRQYVQLQTRTGTLGAQLDKYKRLLEYGSHLINKHQHDRLISLQNQQQVLQKKISILFHDFLLGLQAVKNCPQNILLHQLPTEVNEIAKKLEKFKSSVYKKKATSRLL